MGEPALTGRDKKPILVVGARGFVGQHLYPALAASGRSVRCGSRDPTAARADAPDRQWVYFDVEDIARSRSAFEGCGTAYYLAHAIGQGKDYPDREARAAEAFRDEAARAGLSRIVYLGGVAPRGQGSRHLHSRLRTGEILRSGPIPTVELRAAMVVGRGSASWEIVSDLARRLPAMVLPRWLRNHSWPVDIEDVVYALLRAASLPLDSAAWYDLPGPERLSHEQTLRRVASLQRRSPFMVGVPILSPHLSSYWIAMVTRADLPMARELVEGLRSNLDPAGRSFWDLVPERRPVPIEVAFRRALEDGQSDVVPSSNTRERMAALGRALTIVS